MSSPASPSPALRTVRPALVLLGVLAVAVNLRAALAGYPPLLETIRADLGVGSGVAGLVQAGSVLMMSAGSFGAAALTARIGRERLLGIAVATIALGSALRSVAALPALVGGSVLVGLGIGIAGAQLTGVVKEHLADRAGAVTGAYVVAMMVGATVASAVAVPLAVLLGGWSLSLALWTVPALLALTVWLPVAARISRSRPVTAGSVTAGSVTAGSVTAGSEPAGAGTPEVRTWRDPFARWTACYLAGSSTAFYGWLTWLSPYYESQGWSPQAAGLLLAVWSVAQIPVALLVPAAAERRRRWRFWASLSVLSTVAGTAGALLAPAPETALPWLWTVLIGFGVGSGLPLGLTVIAWRTPTPARSAGISGFAMGIGYLAAGLGPLVMGLLIDVGGFGPAIGLLVAAGLVQGIAVVRIGDRPA
ncbi:MFS transporter [Pseudonocardia kongjuensis]|uniref:MFS transporter n=1 Tax=Pseudonocardia kongjuensis TaxID=102227 RepID=A0ABP4ISZ0_9PSEU